MKTVSSKNIIAKVFRDFGIQETNFVHNAVEWVGEALERIGTTVIYKNVVCKYTVCDHKVCIPPNLERIEAISYNGKRLQLGADITTVGYLSPYSDKIPTSDYEYLDASILPANHEPTSRVVTSNYPNEADELHYYNINPGYIITSFESGEILIYYKAFPTDESGFPLIWDNVYVREACAWSIIYRLLMSGYLHPVLNFQFAGQEYERFILLARSADFPDIDRMERFRDMWVRMVPDVDAYTRFFQHAEQRGDIYR